MPYQAPQAGRTAWLSGPKLAQPRLSLGKAEAEKKSGRIQQNGLTSHAPCRRTSGGTILTTFLPPLHRGLDTTQSWGEVSSLCWLRASTSHVAPKPLFVNGGFLSITGGVRRSRRLRSGHRHSRGCACTFV